MLRNGIWLMISLSCIQRGKLLNATEGLIEFRNVGQLSRGNCRDSYFDQFSIIGSNACFAVFTDDNAVGIISRCA